MPPLIVKTALKCRYGLQNESKYLDINIPASHLFHLLLYPSGQLCYCVTFLFKGFQQHRKTQTLILQHAKAYVRHSSTSI